MYKIELLIEDTLPEDLQAECLLEVGTVIDIGDESGLGIVGRIISVRIRAERPD